MKELIKENHNNHVELIYASGERYHLRSVYSVAHDTEHGVIFIMMSNEENKKIAEGVTHKKRTFDVFEVSVGVLSGLVISHTSKEAVNKYTLQTFLTFVDRGTHVGGIVDNGYFCDCNTSGVGESYTASLRDQREAIEMIQQDAESFVNPDEYEDKNGSDDTYSIQG